MEFCFTKMADLHLCSTGSGRLETDDLAFMLDEGASALAKKDPEAASHIAPGGQRESGGPGLGNSAGLRIGRRPYFSNALIN